MTELYVLLDSGAVVGLSRVLESHRMTATQAFGGEASPQFVLTESVGKELFGAKGFSLSGPNSIVESMDATGHIKLKPWDEVAKLLVNNGNPTRMSTQEFHLEKHMEYNMLNDLAERGKLIGMSTGSYGTEPDPKGKSFSGLKQDSGEISIAAADSDLRKSGKQTFIVSTDMEAAKHILKHPGNAGYELRIMNLENFAKAMGDAGALPPQKVTTMVAGMKSVYRNGAAANLIESGQNISTPAQKLKLQAAYDGAPGELAGAIKASAANAAALAVPAKASPAVEQEAPEGRVNTANAAGASIGTVLGAKNMYDKLADPNSKYHQDVNAGGTRKAFAQAGLATDTATVTAGGVATAEHVVAGLKPAGEGAGALGTFGKVAGKAAIPLAVTAGVLETGSAIAAGDKKRATEAVAGTAGGIEGGLLFATLAGGVPGLLLGLTGAYLGSKAETGLVDGIMNDDGKPLPPAPPMKTPEEIMKDEQRKNHLLQTNRQNDDPVQVASVPPVDEKLSTALLDAKQAAAGVQLLPDSTVAYSPAKKQDNTIARA